jgi:hypothetical protein
MEIAVRIPARNRPADLISGDGSSDASARQRGSTVIPAKARIKHRMPAFAGMTESELPPRIGRWLDGLWLRMVGADRTDILAVAFAYPGP